MPFIDRTVSVVPEACWVGAGDCPAAGLTAALAPNMTTRMNAIGSRLRAGLSRMDIGLSGRATVRHRYPGSPGANGAPSRRGVDPAARVERELDLRGRRVGCRPANCGSSRLGGRKRRPGHRCAESGGRRREEDAAACITCSAARLHVMGVIRRVARRPRQGLRHVRHPAGFRGGHTIVAMSRRRAMRYTRVHGGRERHLQDGEHQEQSGQPAAWHHAYPTARSRGSHAPPGERRPRCERRRSSPRRCR